MIRRILTRFLARLLVDAGRETRRLGRPTKTKEYTELHDALRRKLGPRQRRHRRLML